MSLEKYRQLYNSIIIRPDYYDDLELVEKKIFSQIAMYKVVANKFNIPWIFFAVTHWKEASLRPEKQILNGQNWNRTTTIVPKGRGPYSNWEEAAIDGVLYKGLHKIKDWSLENTLNILESWNGRGYERRGINTPYLWCGSQHYTSGGYPRDGVFSASHVIKNVGCAVIIRHLHVQGIDTGISGLGTVMGNTPIPEPVELPKQEEVKSSKLPLPSWLKRFLRYIKVL